MSNAEAAQGPLDVQLDKPRKCVFDFNSICTYEILTGKNCIFDHTVWTRPSAVQVRALTYATLKSDDPTLTLDKVGEFLTIYPKEIEKVTRYAFARAKVILDGDEKKTTEPTTPN